MIFVFILTTWQICKNNNVVVFGEAGGYIMSLSDGACTPFGIEDNVYVLDLFLAPAEGFRRPGQ